MNLSNRTSHPAPLEKRAEASVCNHGLFMEEKEHQMSYKNLNFLEFIYAIFLIYILPVVVMVEMFGF